MFIIVYSLFFWLLRFITIHLIIVRIFLYLRNIVIGFSDYVRMWTIELTLTGLHFGFSLPFDFVFGVIATHYHNAPSIFISLTSSIWDLWNSVCCNLVSIRLIFVIILFLFFIFLIIKRGFIALLISLRSIRSSMIILIFLLVRNKGLLKHSAGIKIF